MYKIVLSRQYEKSLKRWCRHKDFNKLKLLKVLETLQRGEKLPLANRDHQLTGNLKDYRECHIQNDILLMYQMHQDVLILVLINIGSHSELFD